MSDKPISLGSGMTHILRAYNRPIFELTPGFLVVIFMFSEGFHGGTALGAKSVQESGFEKLHAWFFWSYKAETTPAWCLRKSVELGWLPQNFES
ncbi:hypothetical protein FACS1894116_02320 [Betaproteobacteria bacterium]|nr:hypothetical protein FACS1894116_02320 [Betaproteobacteria bacterium]GHT97319.1 hypothetical protein FACS1894154_00410 [Betaproteobacteria bacterium]GHU27541.1 hypothetical protein FACS189497_00970 [Betaproteobacteria bacterium]